MPAQPDVVSYRALGSGAASDLVTACCEEGGRPSPSSGIPEVGSRADRWGTATDVATPAHGDAGRTPSGTGRRKHHHHHKEHLMPRFLIEREIPNAKDLTQEQLSEIARTSNDAVDSLGVPYTWVTSYVAGDKIYCLHETDDAETVREHARRGGFPADTVSVVANEFGPHSADPLPVA
jgi:Nickel responsive protein SCO4226-like